MNYMAQDSGIHFMMKKGAIFIENEEKVHYVLINNKLYSIDEYISENGKTEVLYNFFY